MKSHTNNTHIPRDYLWKVAPYHSGGFGRIFLATHPSAKCPHIVMKVVKIPARKTEIWPLRMEVEALQRIQKCTKIANHIVEQPSAGGLGEENCIWWSRKDATLTMLFTYYPATLAQISMIYMGISSPLYIKNVVRDILHGLVYLHDLGIIHKDIKPDNIFLDNDGICKIGDLGAAFVCSDPKALQKSTIRTNDPGVRSYDYCAPELVIPLTDPNTIDKHGKHQWCFDERVDFWALGMVVYELVVGTVLRWCECRPDEVWDTIFVQPSEVLENMMDTLRLRAHNCDPDIMRFVQRACQHYYPSRLNGKEAIAIVSKWESCSDPFKNRFEITSSANNARDSEDDINSWLPVDPGKRHPLETKQIERTSSRFQRHLNEVEVYIPENSDYRYVEVVRSQFFSRPK